MKKLSEAKENLPIDFLTQFISKGWSDIGDLKASVEAIKKEFQGTAKVEEVLKDLIDAYLIAIGQLELYLDKKDYLEFPEEQELTEKLILREDSINKEINEDEIEKEEDKEGIEPKNDDKKLEVSPKKEKLPEIDIPEKEIKQVDSLVESKNNSTDQFDFLTDFDEPIPDEEADNAIRAWLNNK